MTHLKQGQQAPLRQRILCVDDNADICEMLTTLLGVVGYDSVSAFTVEEAKRFAAADSFDLFILDKISSHGGGLELCRELRRQHPHTPIIIYSGDAFDRHHREAAQAGATVYVNKPNIKELVSAINKLIKESLVTCELETA